MSAQPESNGAVIDLEANGVAESHQVQENQEVQEVQEVQEAQQEPVAEAPRQADPAPAPEVAFSWLDPHPTFVILLVGPQQMPFGIQKDYLVARSSFYRQYFHNLGNEQQLELMVELPETPVEVFAMTQHYIYTGKVFPDMGDGNLPSYEILIGVWKLGHRLGIDGLCEATLEAMSECRRITQRIPATPLLVQVWEDTPEGSSIRTLLLSWAAEYMRSSDSRAEFARSLPQGVLSELVVAMSSLEPSASTPSANASPVSAQHTAPATAGPSTGQKRQVHYVEGDEGEAARAPAPKKQRHSDVLPHNSTAAAKKPASRPSLPAKTTNRRRSNLGNENHQWTTEQKLTFCSDLLTRMLSGPGFWTRLVGPFKEPVDPVQDAVPDYFDKIKKPMDLGTMKAKMDRGEYNDEEEFLSDMNQIFTNCYTYWTKKDAMWGACEKLQKTFEERYVQMSKWLAKMSGDEGH